MLKTAFIETAGKMKSGVLSIDCSPDNIDYCHKQDSFMDYCDFLETKDCFPDLIKNILIKVTKNVIFITDISWSKSV